MASLKKFTESAVVNQLRHNNRQIRNPRNVDIDPSKFELNYTLSPVREMTDYDYFKKRKSELYCYARKDVKVMAGWVVTAPRALSKEQYDLFFKKTYDFLENRYGRENVIQSVVHCDESGQPHLHFLFIPVSSDPRRGLKICAKEVLTRSELRNFHPDFQRYLQKNGLNVSVQSGITRRQGGNKTVFEMKKERSYQRNEEARRRHF